MVGAPVNGMRWNSAARLFVEQNRAILSKAPTSYFLLSAVQAGGRETMRKRIPRCLDPATAVVPAKKVGLWGGMIPANAPWILRLIFGVKKGPAYDGRDWAAIRAWAVDLAKAYSL